MLSGLFSCQNRHQLLNFKFQPIVYPGNYCLPRMSEPTVMGIQTLMAGDPLNWFNLIHWLSSIWSALIWFDRVQPTDLVWWFGSTLIWFGWVDPLIQFGDLVQLWFGLVGSNPLIQFNPDSVWSGPTCWFSLVIQFSDLVWSDLICSDSFWSGLIHFDSVCPPNCSKTSHFIFSHQNNHHISTQNS